MKFTKEQIEKGIIVVYGKQQALCHSAQEAEEAINSFMGRWGMLEVNPTTAKNLNVLFAGEEFGEPYSLPWLKTTNCSDQFIKLYPALSDTLEGHLQAYAEKCAKEKAERLRLAEQAKRERMLDWSKCRKGWYHVQTEITALSMMSDKRVIRIFSGDVLADSKAGAFGQALEQMNDYCSSNGLVFEIMSEWDSSETSVEFLGMKTDEGYSVEEWEKYMAEKTNNTIQL